MGTATMEPVRELLALGPSFDDVSVLAYLAAFGGGVVSFLSPCVLPLLPAYLSMVTGLDIATLEEGASSSGNTRRIVRTTATFVAGFGIVFVLLELGLWTIGRSFSDNQELFTRISGTVMLMMALFLLGSLFLRAPWLYQEKRFHPQLGRFGDAAPFVAGAAFGFGWSPCIGPVLASILTIGLGQDNAWGGATLLVAYTLGLGLPFLLAGLALGKLGRTLTWVKRNLPALVATSAVILAIFGLLLMFDQLSRVSSELQQALDGTPLEWAVKLG
jgi:cytochrome c-type biogenesis protein